MRPRKSEVIVETALRLFLDRGYDSTSMDDVAATSGASKTTVYNNFEDKEKLFRAVIMQVTTRAEELVDHMQHELKGEQPPAERLRRVAHRLARGVLNPMVIQLRRLAIAEAHRFPDLVTTYWDRAPGRTVELLEAAFTDMNVAGELDIPDTHEAAMHFAYAVSGPYQDRALLRPGDTIADTDIARHVESTVDRFIRAYSHDGATPQA